MERLYGPVGVAVLARNIARPKQGFLGAQVSPVSCRAAEVCVYGAWPVGRLGNSTGLRRPYNFLAKRPFKLVVLELR